MTLRKNDQTEREKKAHELLDLVRAGVDVGDGMVRWALVVLGDVT